MTVVFAVLGAWFGWTQLGLDAAGSAVTAALAAAVWGAFGAIFWPYVACPVIGCDKGKFRRPGKRTTYRKCSWCGGRGERVRWARRLYDEVRPAKHGRRR